MPRTPSGQIHWVEAGPQHGAPAVVLLHGLGGDAGFWAAEQQSLARHFRVLAVDLRGSGSSPSSDGPFSIQDLAREVVGVLDAAGIDAAHVVGFSMGGLVAQAMAVEYPARVCRLVLAATFATTNVQARLFLHAVGSVYRGGASAKQMFELVLPWLFSSRFLSDPRAAPYLDYPEDADEEQPREDWLKLLDAQLAFDGQPRLLSIKAPTLVIAGEEDRLASLADAEQLAQGIKGGVLQVLQGGHLMNVESPEAFQQALVSFLAA